MYSHTCPDTMEYAIRNCDALGTGTLVIAERTRSRRHVKKKKHANFRRTKVVFTTNVGNPYESSVFYASLVKYLDLNALVKHWTKVAAFVGWSSPGHSIYTLYVYIHGERYALLLYIRTVVRRACVYENVLCTTGVCTYVRRPSLVGSQVSVGFRRS